MNEKIEALDIKFPADTPIPSAGIAYYRIPADFRDFLKKCRVEHNVIGFSYEFGELNFGVILQDKNGNGGK